MSELLTDCKLSVFGNHFTSSRPGGQSMVFWRFMYSLVGKTEGGGVTRQKCPVQGGRDSWVGLTAGRNASTGESVVSCMVSINCQAILVSTLWGPSRKHPIYSVNLTSQSWSPTLIFPVLNSLVLPAQSSV